MPPKADAKPADTIGGEWEEIQPFTEPINLEPGEDIIGLYLGAESINVPALDNDDNENVIVVDGKRVRPTLLHEIMAEGATESVGVWGSALLDKRLADVPNGSRIRILYEGKRELEGGRTARQYRVWQDKTTPL